MGELGVGHRGPDRDRAKRLPDAALERRPAQVERETETFARPVHEADHLRQMVVDVGLVYGELALRKTGREIRFQFMFVGADQNGADARGATGKQDLARGASADS